MLLNRRGFATAVFCRQCAGTLDCPNCSVSLVVHGEGNARRARCHYCNYTARVPAACPLCAGPYLEQTGFGTERVEAEVQRRVPARASRGSIATPSAARARCSALLARFRDGEIDVLVGTQMIAKGHDFPRVTLVGVVVGRRRPRPRRLPRVGADLPAADAGGRPRRTRRAAGRGDRPDALSRITTASSSPAGRTIRRSSSASCSSAARCGIRRSCRWSTPSSAARTFAARDGRCGGRRADGCATRTAAAATCACSVPRRRRSASCAASTARSC